MSAVGGDPLHPLSDSRRGPDLRHHRQSPPEKVQVAKVGGKPKNSFEEQVYPIAKGEGRACLLSGIHPTRFLLKLESLNCARYFVTGKPL